MVLQRITQAGVPPAQLHQKYHGKWRGIVGLIDENHAHDAADRQGRGRLRAFVPAVLGNRRMTGWARPCFPLAGGNPTDHRRLGDEFGIFYMPRQGDLVWIEFEQGDIRKPIWTGFIYPINDDDKSRVGIPSLARESDDGTLEVPHLDPDHVYGIGVELDGSDWTNRPTPDADRQTGNDYAAIYPFNMVLKTRSGHTIEIDDSRGAARIRIRHRSGSQIQFRHDGSLRIFAANECHVVSDGKMFLKAPAVDVGAGQNMGGCLTERTQPVCMVTGLPLSVSRSVKANS